MSKRAPLAIIAGALVVLAAGAAMYLWKDDAPRNMDHVVEVRLPELSPLAVAGSEIFAGNCVACHGENAAGGPGGPPLVHKIYEPSHHGDRSFLLAVSRGVRAHHWPFGDMPAIEGLTIEDVARIVVYVRELQAANGIR